MNTRWNRGASLVVAMLIGFLAPLSAGAQYSQEVFTLKKLSELYDERGFEQGKAISVDGNLMVSGSNGGVSYSYPISKTTVNGFPLEVNLNYCGSVAFTAFKDYYTGGYTDPYRRWGKFQQNRAAWIVGVNGFAVQALAATSGSFHGDSALASANSGTIFDDTRMIWTIDGYDFCNSMTPLEQEDHTGLLDEIHILRADGSVMQLVHRIDSGQDEPAAHPEVYTGYYFPNEANAHGFGIVEFDEDGWPGFVHDSIDAITGGIDDYPYIPRKLHYFPGDGLEYVFGEWVIPYGIKPYLGRGEGVPDRWGGIVAGPTIFYLQEIRSNLGLVSSFTRSRHFYPNVHTTLDNGNIYDPKFDFIEDSTRGRALITDFYGHTISYGDVGMTIEAFGRTTKVLFKTQSRSGGAGSDEYMPLGSQGYMTYATQGQAAAEERSPGLYKSFVGYVDKIIDPEGRETSFEYEPYTRTYIGYNFPYTNSSVGVRLKNYRLKKVTEPTAAYTISYKRGANLWPDEDTKLTDTLYEGVSDPGHNSPFLLNNVASYVRKYDRDETLLTTQYGLYSHDGNSFYAGTQTTTDNISGHIREVRTAYKIYPLFDYFTWLPHANYTGLISTTEIAGDLTTATSVNYDSMALAPNVVLPVKQTVSVNGVLKSDQRFTYALDTVRTYGGDDTLTGKFGWEVTRKVTTTLDPGTSGVLLRDTTEYTYVPLVDTTLTRLDTFYLKFKMMENYRRLRDSGLITVPWEYAFYDPRVLEVTLDSQETRGLMPPMYGMEKRSWLSLADGTFLRGREKFYRNPSPPFHYLNSLEFRGALDSEVVTGEGGVRTFLATRYEYADNWKKLPSRITNANGALQRLYYGFSSLNTPGHNFEALGHIRYDNDVVHDTVLPNGDYFAFSYEKAPGIDRYVRRYTDTNLAAMVTDTLRELSEYSYFGQTIGRIDLNGNYSRFSYDRNGRLLRAWLPYDFPRREDPDTAEYYGTETIGLYGYTRYSARVDTLICRPAGDTNTISHDSTSDTVTVEGLYAAHPIGETGHCAGGCGDGPFGSSKREDLRQMLRFCQDTIRYPLDEYYVGVLRYLVDSASPLLTIDPLSHAYLELNTTSISSGCVTLTVEIPQFSYSHAITFNCEVDSDPGDGDGGTGLGKGKRHAPTIQSGGADSTRLVRLDLTSLVSDLHGLAANNHLTINLKVTTANGAIAFVDGSNGEDTRPRLLLEGTIHTISDEADYTLAYDHNDTTLTTTVRAKVDDSLHTADWYGRSSNGGSSLRLTEATHYFGADYRVKRSDVAIGDYRSPSRYDSVVNAYSGLGEKSRVIDPEGDTVVTRYDTAGRPVEVINPDGTRSTIDYQISSPSFGDQDFYGFCMRKRTTDERGIQFEQYYDAFDRLRREISGISPDTTRPARTVKYEYDLLGNLTEVTNPAGDVTTYTYDDFGRVKHKTMADIGTVSYAYDRVGNVRFSQTQEQSNRHMLSFTEYDDLNRPTLIGEALVEKSGCSVFCEDSLYDASPYSCGSSSTASWLTDSLDPDVLHIAPGATVLTANPTLFGPPGTIAVDHVIGNTITDTITSCTLSASPLLGEASAPSGPKIMHPAQIYSGCFASATTSDFENMMTHTPFARIAINYDRLPTQGKSVWGPFPTAAIWDALAPTGVVRNLKGHEAAVAYRERASEPFHYTVLSYDDRGRVEAILRCTENLGFDAVYYSYNAINQVTSVTVSDPLRSYTTWYGYDYNGRVDSVWASLGNPGSGLIAGGARKSQGSLAYPASLTRTHPDQSADIGYHYRKGGQVDSMSYPPVDVLVSYAYNQRKWLDTLIATQGGSFLFREALKYDSSGQIISQSSKHVGSVAQTQDYRYDNHDQLTTWTAGSSLDSVMYRYDPVGNRLGMHDTRLADSAILAYGGQPNQLTQRDQPVTGGDTTHSFAYDADGGLRWRQLTYIDSSHSKMRTLWAEQERYSYRGLFNWSHRTDSLNNIFDWRYRYSASGEREQKRLVYTTVFDSVMGYPQVYYALGGSNQQLAVYHGQQVSDTKCGQSGRRVYMYPTEYLTHGIAYTGKPEDVSQVITDANGNKQYRIFDHLASLRVLLDQAGTTHFDYDPWGAIITVGGGTASRRTFNDREKDLENGFYNLGVREMDNEDGVFRSPDPLQEKSAGWSTYAYSNNNPMRFTDPEGKQAKDLMKLFGIIGYANPVFLPIATLSSNTSRADDAANSENFYGKPDVYVDGYRERPKWKGTVYNGPIDAVRHVFWSSLNAQSFGATTARWIGKLHEVGEPEEESAMDLNNNEVGIKIALAHPNASADELYGLAKDALEAGQLQACPNCPKVSKGMSIPGKW